MNKADTQYSDMNDKVIEDLQYWTYPEKYYPLKECNPSSDIRSMSRYQHQHHCLQTKEMRIKSRDK